MRFQGSISVRSIARVSLKMVFAIQPLKATGLHVIEKCLLRRQSRFLSRPIRQNLVIYFFSNATHKRPYPLARRMNPINIRASLSAFDNARTGDILRRSRQLPGLEP